MTNNHNQTVVFADETPQKPSKLAKAFAPVTAVFSFLKRRTNLTMWIVVGMIAGILVGRFAPQFAQDIGPMGTVFLRMIGCLVGPLIFSTLVVGIAGHGDDLARVGRLAIKSIVYFEVVTTFALVIGLLAVNIAKPGAGFTMDGLVDPNIPLKPITWVTEMESIVPEAFFQAMADHKAVLAIVFCAVMFSVAIMRADAPSKKVMIDFNSSLSNIMFKVVELVMNYAPIGIACALAATVGKYGLGVLVVTGKLVGTLYATLVIFVLIVLLPILLMARIPLLQFARAVGPPFLMAFATASSESALPKAMENMVAFGCPPEIVAFVIPTGYSFNLDGSTLYLALAAMFCAQVAGVTKTVGEQIVIMLTLMLSSKGVAAVPRASFIVLIGTLSNANIPLQPLSLILGVDAFMDMARTSINVLGNMTACCIVAKWEGEFRNAAWQARQDGQLIDTPAMQEVEVEQFSHIQHHAGHTLGGLHAEKMSIHSTSSAVGAHPGSNAQQRRTSGDQIV
ncbi:MAG: Sodium:dicarboxylate symporter family-domain-containing protein [Linnemannia gamsii]|nr:MAG: Sodium:dicarboxylate symporter family-domain-containing protein [Linnemannia gamsii]